MVRKVLLICGIQASLLYVGADIVAAMSWEGYRYTDQTVSELRALGAPTRPFLVPALLIYAILEIAFGWGVRGAAGQKRALRITGVLLIGLGVVDLVAPFSPMHLRGTAVTLTDTIHVILTVVTVLLILLIIGFGAAADGKRSAQGLRLVCGFCFLRRCSGQALARTFAARLPYRRSVALPPLRSASTSSSTGSRTRDKGLAPHKFTPEPGVHQSFHADRFAAC